MNTVGLRLMPQTYILVVCVMALVFGASVLAKPAEASHVDPFDDDHDGVTWGVDNCAFDYNPAQADTDQDGVGDACDPASVYIDNPTDNSEVSGTVKISAIVRVNRPAECTVTEVSFRANERFAGYMGAERIDSTPAFDPDIPRKLPQTADGGYRFSVDWNTREWTGNGEYFIDAIAYLDCQNEFGTYFTSSWWDGSANEDPYVDVTVANDYWEPWVTTKINGGATATQNSSVNLSISAFDDAPSSGLDSMRFQNRGGEWSSWEPYATTKSWTLKNADGYQTVYVQVRDKAGNVGPAGDGITIDRSKPTISAMSPKHRSIIRDTTPTITATVKDNTTLKKSNMKLYVAGKSITRFSYNASKLTYASPKLPKGKKTVKIVVRDAAGNVGARSWYFTIK